MELIKELLAEAKSSPFDKELDALYAKTGLSAEDIKRKKDLEALENSVSKPPSGDSKLEPTYGPFLKSVLVQGDRGREIWLMKFAQDGKAKVKVQVVSNYHNDKDAQFDKLFDNTKAGYITAAEYFLETVKKLKR